MSAYPILAGIWLFTIIGKEWQGRAAIMLLLASPTFLYLGISENLAHRCAEISANYLITTAAWLASGMTLGAGSGLVARALSPGPLTSFIVAIIVLTTGVVVMTFALGPMLMTVRPCLSDIGVGQT